MSSIVSGYEYDIFISYRQKDNKGDRWVSTFVESLRNEIESTFKEEINVYFDINSNDGLLETHNVDASLKTKLKCLVFIPVISKTYCDLNSYAWQNELCAFNKLAREENIGRDIKLVNGNVASRILPVKIHELTEEDTELLEKELGGALRSIEFIFRAPGVNRPLSPSDNPDKNLNQILYRDQINKVANSIQEIITGIRNIDKKPGNSSNSRPVATKVRALPFRKELRRRNVLRPSLVYIITSLALWKAIGINSDILDLSDDTLRFISMMLIILFPFATTLAWFFERSPRGFILTGSAASSANPYSDDQKKPFTSNTFISLLMATTIALFLLFPKTVRHHPLPSDTINDQSIAVLPFVDLSPGHDKEYFSEGMMEEILNNLYKIGELKVISRTSSMQYKGEMTKSLKEIAKELGVQNILEGSVRLQGKKVRIAVQLIRAETDEHLWAETYDRDFSDVFSIQSDVAQDVASALKAKISPEALRIINSKPTSSAEAYDLWLKANKLNMYNDKENARAIEMYKKAITLDPNFSSAYYELGFRYISGSTYLTTAHGIDPVASWKMAKPYFEKSLELNPDNGQAHIYMAWALLWYEWDFAGAEKEYMESRRIFPNYSWTDFEVTKGHYEQAYQGAVTDIETDTKNENAWQGVIVSAYFAGRNADSIIRKALATPVMKDNIYVRSESARVFMYLKKYDQAVSIVRQLNHDFPDVNSPRLDAIEAISFYNTNRPDETNRILDELIQRSNRYASGSPSFYIAMIYSVMGKTDLAFDWLEKSFKAHEVEMYWLRTEPLFESLRQDPRYKSLLLRVGFSH
jgi:TolB-like protein